MNLGQIRTFLSVANEGSFSKAAKKEYLSSSALIQRIQLLEKELNFSLFDRGSSGVQLTPSGREFYDGLMAALPNFELLIKKCQQIAIETTQTLTIGFFEGSQPCFTPDIVNLFIEQHPEFKIHYVSASLTSVLDDIRNNKYEICEYPLTEDVLNSELCFIHYRFDSRWALMEPHDDLASYSYISRKDLKGRKIVMADFRWCPKITEWLKQEPDITLEECPCISQNIYETCMLGNIYLIPERAASQFQSLKAIPFSSDFATDYGFIYRKNISLAAQEFISFITEISEA